MKKIWWWLMSSQVVKALLAFGIIALLLVGTFAYGNNKNKVAQENLNKVENINLDLQPDVVNDDSSLNSNNPENLAQNSDNSQSNSDATADADMLGSAENNDKTSADDQNGKIASGVSDHQDSATDQDVKEVGTNLANTTELEVTTENPANNQSGTQIPATGINGNYYLVLSLLSVLYLTNLKIKRQVNL